MMTNLAFITFLSLCPAQPGDRYTEYGYPITTNVYTTNQFNGVITTNTVTNVSGIWLNPSRRLVLWWNGRDGSNYVVETSVSLTTQPHPAGTTNEGWMGDGWRPCSLILTGRNGTMGWTSGVPNRTAFLRLRHLQ